MFENKPFSRAVCGREFVGCCGSLAGGAGEVVEWADGEGGWGGTAGDGGADAGVDQWRGEREDKVFGVGL